MPLILDLPPLERPVLVYDVSSRAVQPPLAAKSGGSKKKSSKKNNKPHWDKDAYVRAAGGGQVFTANNNNFTAIVVGGEAGVQYEFVNKKWPRWGGMTRVGGSYVVSGDNASGTDLRLGTFFGPRGKSVGLLVGPDVFYNVWSYGQHDLPEAFGVDLPVTVTATPGKLTAFAGGLGTWTNTPQRAKNWGAPMHEAAGFAGVGFTLEGVDVIARYEYRLTAAGDQQTILLTAKIDGGTIWDLLDQTDGSGSGNGNGSGGNSGGGGDDEAGSPAKK